MPSRSSYGSVTVTYGSANDHSMSTYGSTPLNYSSGSGYYSSSSTSSGSPEPGVRHTSYPDPTAKGYKVEYVDRTKKSGDVVTVVNHHKRHYNEADPSPSYSTYKSK